MLDEIALKCGKTISSPSMFINLNYPSEGRVARQIVARYSTDVKKDGLGQIDGIAVSIKDWKTVSPPILSGYLGKAPKHKLIDKVRLIFPSLYLLFNGTELDKKALLETINASQELIEIINKIAFLEKRKEKFDKKIDEIYPLLDTSLIRMLLQHQIQNGADILISPSVPITSNRRISEQINKASEMNRVSRILLGTVFSAYKEERDLMHVLTINPSVLKNDYIEAIKQTVLINNPDHVGIRILNLDEKNTSQVWTLLRLIKDLSESIPVHVFNVREFGYITHVYGASSITTPIATDPYFRRSDSEQAPPRQGSYYHPIDMTNDTYDAFLEKTRSKNYRFPCHCEICEKFLNIPSVEKNYWNEFRRIHFLLVKNMEMKELRDAASHLRIALKDKIARSHQTVWLPYLG